MDLNTLEKANALNRKISQFEEALNCFEWAPEEDMKPISTDPRVIIEFNGDGREQIALPMNLSNTFIDFMKAEIKKGLEQAKSEFAAL